MATTLFYTRILTPYTNIEPAALVISDDGKIAYAGPVDDIPQVTGKRYDLRGLSVVPGFIDIHVHGGNGVTFGGTDIPQKELQAYSEWVVRNGVTGFLCSLAAPDAPSLVYLVEQYVEAMKLDGTGAKPLGIHLEGPFISKEKKGAFNPDWIRLPDLQEMDAVLKAGQGWIRQITLAPELPQSEAIASRCRQAGVVVSLGHTNCDYETASSALQGNYTHITHTFNAQSGFHHRQPGVFGAILSSEHATAEIVADNVHAHPAAIKILIRCLGTDRVALITDAMAAAGLSDGIYDLVGQKVNVVNGHANLEDGTIAGSTVVLNQCVHNVCELAGVDLVDAVKMASLVPARAMGMAGWLGIIKPGIDANLAVIDDSVNVHMTFVHGKLVYSSF
jgi:N-acetylglucosamine-6-phosphate deacetylase